MFQKVGPVPEDVGPNKTLKTPAPSETSYPRLSTAVNTILPHCAILYVLST